MRKQFAALDTLRTILAVGVALGHYFYWNNTPTPFPQSFFLAVDFFFVLSGFVLTQSILNESSPDGESFVKKFFLRRVFRLWPLYTVVFAVETILLILDFGRDLDPAYYFLTSFLLLQSIGFDAGARQIFQATTIGIAWSISVEFWLGIVYFPAIFALRQKPNLIALSCGIAAIFALLLLINFSPLALNVNLQRVGVIFTLGSVRGLLGFALGTLAFIFYRAIDGAAINKAPATLLEIVLISSLYFLYGRNGYNHQNDYVAPIIFAIVILVVALGNGAVSKFLSMSTFRLFRPLSYAIYLVHPFFIYAWSKLGIPYGHKFSLIYIVIVVLAATILQKYIERPGIIWGKRVASHI